MNLRIILTCIFLVCGHLFAQPAAQWQKNFGGNFYDYAFDISQSSDGNFYIVGRSNSAVSGNKTDSCRGHDDYWLIKINALGDLLWERTLGGNNDDVGTSVKATPDLGCIVAGGSGSTLSGDKTESSNGDDDAWIIKLDSAGNIEWQRSIGGWDSDFAVSIALANDGGYVVACISTSNISADKTENRRGGQDFWVFKINSTGGLLWQKTIGGSNEDYSSSIERTQDGGFLIGGTSLSDISGEKTENAIGQTDYWILKIDSVGTILWQKTLGGITRDRLMIAKETSDGGYIVGGYSDSNASGDKTENSRGTEDYWVIKLDSQRNIQWQKTLGGNLIDNLISIAEEPAGEFILGGYSASGVSGDRTAPDKGGFDIWLIKLNSTGNIIWQKAFGGDQGDFLWSMKLCFDGSFICAGSSASNISGDKTEDVIGLSDYWIVKFASGNDIENTLLNRIHFYPNPCSGILHVRGNPNSDIQVRIYDAIGNLVFTDHLLFEKDLNLSFLANGIYELQMSIDDKRQFRKILLIDK